MKNNVFTFKTKSLEIKINQTLFCKMKLAMFETRAFECDV